VRSGPLLIGYDGTRAAEHALREATRLLAHRRAQHAHGPIIGGTSRSVLRDAQCPVVVARGAGGRGRG
jgi:nucleotide-binding universal stress UspA family protein